MKYVVIIPSGAADRPLKALDDLTPLEVADTPHIDALARSGRVGTVQTTPKRMQPGSDLCAMTILGYDPAEFFSGHAPLLARGDGVKSDASQSYLALDLVSVGGAGTVQEGLMIDHASDSLPDLEARELLKGLAAHWGTMYDDEWRDFGLTHIEGAQAILNDRSDRLYVNVDSSSPHVLLDRAWEPALPSGGVSGEGSMLARLIRSSFEFLSRHEINLARIEQGLRPANMAWIWGMGNMTVLPSFQSRNRLCGVMLCSDPSIAGLAESIGLDVVANKMPSVQDSTGYERIGQALVNAIEIHDVVCCHVSTPRECSHRGDYEQKIKAIEAIDRFIVGPASKRLQAYGNLDEKPDAIGWRMMVVSDHATLSSTRVHDSMDVPVMIAGGLVESVVARAFTEREAEASDLHIKHGSDLMEYFLRSGLPRVYKT